MNAQLGPFLLPGTAIRALHPLAAYANAERTRGGDGTAETVVQRLVEREMAQLTLPAMYVALQADSSSRAGHLNRRSFTVRTQVGATQTVALVVLVAVFARQRGGEPRSSASSSTRTSARQRIPETARCGSRKRARVRL